MNAQTKTSISVPRPRPQWWKYRWAVPLGIAAVALVAFIAAQLSMSSPATVTRITFRNNSSYDLLVSATGASRDGVTSLGTAVAHTSTEVDDVIDQGDEWIFHFEGQARDGGEVQVSRRELAGAHWTFTIPDAVGERLRAAGATSSPPVGN
jgi:hypothetical protein